MNFSFCMSEIWTLFQLQAILLVDKNSFPSFFYWAWMHTIHFCLQKEQIYMSLQPTITYGQANIFTYGTPTQCHIWKISLLFCWTGILLMFVCKSFLMSNDKSYIKRRSQNKNSVNQIHKSFSELFNEWAGPKMTDSLQTVAR